MWCMYVINGWTTHDEWSASGGVSELLTNGQSSMGERRGRRRAHVYIASYLFIHSRWIIIGIDDTIKGMLSHNCIEPSLPRSSASCSFRSAQSRWLRLAIFLVFLFVNNQESENGPLPEWIELNWIELNWIELNEQWINQSALLPSIFNVCLG